MSVSKFAHQSPHRNDVEQQKSRGTTDHISSRKTSILAGAVLLFVSFSWCLSAFYLFPSVPVVQNTDLRPHVYTHNGTYVGVHSEYFGQDYFLGIPYAQPPTADLRFRRPQASNMSWIGTREAVEYSPHCVGAGEYSHVFPESEDCLTINVIRPSRMSESQNLPVLVYLYGGGRDGGGSSQSQYNMTFLVNHAEIVGFPCIGVSFNFRHALLGFLPGRQALESASSNLGLHDQRLALRWIRENIAAFGGDPHKVTLWGTSSGADSVGLHLVAHEGRDERLFRAAIMSSGGPVVYHHPPRYSSQRLFDDLVSLSNCTNTNDSIDCLRSMNLDRLVAVTDQVTKKLGFSNSVFGDPALDGDFLMGHGSIAIKDEKFIKVPVLSGTVTREAGMNIPHHVGSWGDFRNVLTHVFPTQQSAIDRLLDLYSPIGGNETKRLEPPIESITDWSLFDAIESVLGDIRINAAHQLLCEAVSRHMDCYSYRFDALAPYTHDNRLGAVHGAEVSALFHNTYETRADGDPAARSSPQYNEMAFDMRTRWASFVSTLDPNHGNTRYRQRYWPKFSADQPRSLLFKENSLEHTSIVNTTTRPEALQYLNEIFATAFER